MRNTALLSMLLAGASFVSAQTDPNRMLIVSETGTTGHKIENVKEINFATVEGKVAAEVQLLTYSKESLKVNVQRSEACAGFMIDLVPGVMAHQLESNPASAGAYLRQHSAPTYTDDFEGGEMSGFLLESATEYAVVTLGIDRYGVEGDVSAVYFTTPSATLNGDPRCEGTFVSCTKNEIVLNIKANADVREYYTLIGEKGTLMSQYEQFAPMFGFVNVGQMVQMWSGQGYAGNSSTDKTFSDLAPNTEYEIFLQPVDTNGEFGPLTIVYASTQRVGGDGEAVVNITFGDYKLADWDGQMLPSQYITYTPNDQTWCYRIRVDYKADYEANKDEIIDALRSDPPMSVAHWFQYEAITTDYQINPGTEIVATAVAKNAEGEWGPVTEVYYTTPATAPTAVAQRQNKARVRTQGRVPAQNVITLKH